MQPTPTTTFDEVLQRATSLYSPPAVAMEVVRLTAEPRVDARALRDCVARDPAMTAKLLRVVNSSVYGLRGEVTDLNQAIALLGVASLKLLVLGFSLPDDLLSDIGADALRRYWTDTLTRAAAARRIAEIGWGRGADEAQLAALLQGVGQLVLLSQLGEPYSGVLERFHEQTDTGGPDDAASLAALEREALGFEHRSLTAELLRRWSLPAEVVDSIAVQAEPERLADDDRALPRVLRLAELLMRLVGRRRLSALSLLVEEGEAYCSLTRRQINTLVERLQDDVQQLADATAVELEEGADYRQTLLDAHAQLAVAAEGGAGLLLGACPRRDADDRLCDELLAGAAELRAAMRAFLRTGAADGGADGKTASAHGARQGPRRPHRHAPANGAARLAETTARVAASCRAAREALTMAIVELGSFGVTAEPPVATLRVWLRASAWGDDAEGAVWTALSDDRCGVLLPGVERHDAARILNAACDEWEANGAGLDAGIASIALVPKGFEPDRLIAAAERCLAAARTSASASVKSIEVY